MNSKSTRKPGKKLWIILAVVAVLAIAGGFTYYKIDSSKTSATEETGVQTATARQGDLTLMATGSGTLTASTSADLGFTVAGKVAEITVDIGDKVQEGQLLARLDDTDLQNALSQAKQNLLELTSASALATAKANAAQAQKDLNSATASRSGLTGMRSQASIDNAYAAYVLAEDAYLDAKADYDRVSGLPENSTKRAMFYQRYYLALVARNHALYIYNIYSGKASQTDIDAYDAKVEYAQARLEEAQIYLAALKSEEIPEDATGTELAKLVQARLNLKVAQDNLAAASLYAPFSGTVMSINSEVGESVGSNSVILTLSDLDVADLIVYLDENDWNNVKEGYTAEVTFDALPDTVFTGKVTLVYPALVSTQGSSMIEAMVRLDEIPSTNGVPLPLYVSATVDVISAESLNTILIPVEALHSMDSGQYFVLVMENGTPTMRIVEVGLQDDTYVEITSGLSAGEVVTTGIVETGQ